MKMKDKKVLILTGPTRYDIDIVRYIGSKSTGRLGYYLSKESLKRGYDTTVVYGPGKVEMPEEVNLINVYTTEEMLKATLNELEKEDYQVAIFSAAILDFKPARSFKKKLRSGQELKIELVPTPKVIKKVRNKYPELFIVGFKLEYNLEEDELLKRGYKALRKQKSDLLVINDFSDVRDGHKAILIGKDRNTKKIGPTKQKVAEGILGAIEKQRDNRQKK